MPGCDERRLAVALGYLSVAHTRRRRFPLKTHIHPCHRHCRRRRYLLVLPALFVLFCRNR